MLIERQKISDDKKELEDKHREVCANVEKLKTEVEALEAECARLKLAEETARVKAEKEIERLELFYEAAIKSAVWNCKK